MKFIRKRVRKILRILLALMSVFFLSLNTVGAYAVEYGTSIGTGSVFDFFSLHYPSTAVLNNLNANIKALNLDYKDKQILLTYDSSPTIANRYYSLSVLPMVTSSTYLLPVGTKNETTGVTSLSTNTTYDFDINGNYIGSIYITSEQQGTSERVSLVYTNGLFRHGRTIHEETTTLCNSYSGIVKDSGAKQDWSCQRYQTSTGNLVIIHNYFYVSFGSFESMHQVFNDTAIDRNIQIEIKNQLQQLNDNIGGVNNSVQDVNNSVKDVNESVTDVNNSINDSSVDTSTGDSFFNGFESNSFGLTSIVSAPLQLIQNINNNSCTDIPLPLPYINKSIALPCMTSIYQEMFGGFLSIWQTITTGFISYYVLIRLFSSVKNMKNPDNDDIEVADL